MSKLPDQLNSTLDKAEVINPAKLRDINCLQLFLRQL